MVEKLKKKYLGKGKINKKEENSFYHSELSYGTRKQFKKMSVCTIHHVCCAHCSGQMLVTKDLARKWEGCITFAICGCHGGKAVSRSIVNFWGLFRIGDCQASLHQVIATSFGAFACTIFEVWFTWLSYVWLLEAQVD